MDKHLNWRSVPVAEWRCVDTGQAVPCVQFQIIFVLCSKNGSGGMREASAIRQIGVCAQKRVMIHGKVVMRSCWPLIQIIVSNRW